MEMIPIKKWGNSNGLRIPKHVMDFLNVQTDDKLKITQEEVNGKKRLIIEAAELEKDITIEELFADYNGEKFQVTPDDFGGPVGKEKW